MSKYDVMAPKIDARHHNRHSFEKMRALATVFEMLNLILQFLKTRKSYISPCQVRSIYLILPQLFIKHKKSPTKVRISSGIRVASGDFFHYLLKTQQTLTRYYAFHIFVEISVLIYFF